MNARSATTALCVLVACGLTACGGRGAEIRTTPGVRVEVSNFDIEGVTVVKASELKDVLATEESGSFPWSRQAYFDREDFDADQQRIQAFLIDRGYPHARVVETDIVPNESGDAVSLRIVIDEGLPIRVSDVVLQGFDPPLNEGQIRRLEGQVPLTSGEPLARARMLEAAEVAADGLRNSGYAHAQVNVDQRPSATPVPNSSSAVDIILTATPGILTRFGEIEVTGNVGVSENVVTRQLPYRPGQLFTRNAVDEGQRKLYSLGLFEFASIEVAEQDPSVENVRTRVTLTEADHREVEFAIGYGTEEQVSGEIWLTHVNLFGGARKGTAHGKWSWLDRGVEVSFLEPAFLKPRLSLSIEGHGWYADQRAYTVLTRGGRASVNYGYGARTRTAGSLSYTHELQNSQISDAALADPSLRDELIALGLDPTTGKQDGVLSAIALEVSRNTAGDPLNPRRGYVASILLEQAGGWLPGAFNYYNLLGEGRHYRTIRGITLAGRVRYGSIRPMGPRSDVPFAKRYFLGGAENLRGWGRYEVSPLSPQGQPIGGHTLLLATAEVRFPMTGRLGGVGFVDSGNVSEDAWKVPFGDLRYDAGVGLRYASPVGPIRLDFGYQLTPIEGLRVDGQLQDRRWRVHFSIGQAF